MSRDREVDLAAETDAAWTTFRRRLADRLEELEEDDLLLLEVESGTPEQDLAGCAPYLQLCGWGDGMIRAEAVSNAYLDERYELGDDGNELLLVHGWNPPDDEDETVAERNYWLDLHHDDVEQLAAMVVRALREVYGCPHPAFVACDDFDCVEGRPAVDANAAIDASRAAEVVAVQPTSAAELQALVDAALEAMFEDAAEHDEDGDLPVTCGLSRAFVRVSQDMPAVDLFAHLVLEVEVTPQAVAEVNRVNAGSVGRQLSLVDGMVLARTRVLATPFVPAQLRAAVATFCEGLDELAEQLVSVVGGRRFLDTVASAPARAVGPVQGATADLSLTALLEVLHEDPAPSAATVAVLVGDRRTIVRHLVAIRRDGCDLDGHGEDLVLGHLRRALRHLAEREAQPSERPGRHRRARSRQLALLPDEESLDGGSWDADLG